MLNRLTRPHVQTGGVTRNLKRNRIWLILGVIAFVVVMAFQLMGGGSSPSSSGDNAQQTGESSEFLADGYAALDDDTEADSSSSMWGVWGGILIPLAIVIACIYGGLKGLKYVNGRVARVSSQAKVLESLDVLPLSQSNAIHLVRIGPRVLAVGASGQQLSVLTELEGEQADEIVNACRAKAQAPSPAGNVLEPFRDIVQKRLHRQTPPAEETTLAEPVAAVHTPSAPVVPAAANVVAPSLPTAKPVAAPPIAAAPVVPAPPLDTAAALSPIDAETSASAVERLEAALNQIHPDNQSDALPDQGRREMRDAVLKAQAEWLASGTTGQPPADRPKRAPRERSANA